MTQIVPPSEMAYAQNLEALSRFASKNRPPFTMISDAQSELTSDESRRW